MQVVIGADYPTRAPEFRIRFLSGIPEKKPQPVSDGGGSSAVVQSDIRLVETEVSFYPLYCQEYSHLLANQKPNWVTVVYYSCSVLVPEFFLDSSHHISFLGGFR